MQNNSKVNSVRNLTSLYTVVIGVALTLAISSLIDRDSGLESVTLPSAFLFISLIVTIIPFYHGALRHLDDAYIENENPQIRDGAFIFDFLLLFLHAIGFVGMSLLLFNPSQFIWVFLLLLFVDIVWGLFTYFGSSTQSPNGAEGKWASINFAFMMVACIYLIANGVYFNPPPDPVQFSLLVMVFCLVRTVIDYWWCKAFYFPKD